MGISLREEMGEREESRKVTYVIGKENSVVWEKGALGLFESEVRLHKLPLTVTFR